MMENGAEYCFVTYVRVGRSTNSESLVEGKFEVKNFSFLPKMIPGRHEEFVYVELVRDVILDGIPKSDRTGTGTLTKFGCQMRYNLQRSFPLLTTKKVFWRGVVEELLWFISGSTNAKIFSRVILCMSLEMLIYTKLTSGLWRSNYRSNRSLFLF